MKEKVIIKLSLCFFPISERISPAWLQDSEYSCKFGSFDDSRKLRGVAESKILKIMKVFLLKSNSNDIISSNLKLGLQKIKVNL